MILAILFLISADPATTAGPVGEFIFPKQKLHNHSSCIVSCANGDLICCWYRGSGERRADDVKIMGARLRARSKTWSEPFVLADTPDLPDCNPILHIDRKRQLWVIWPVILDNHWETALLKYRRSIDYLKDGPPIWAWQDTILLKPAGLDADLHRLLAEIPVTVINQFPKLKAELEEAKSRAGQKVFQRLGWMPRIHAFETEAGELLLPLYCDTFSISLIARTKDAGESWQTSRPILGLGAVQPSLVRKPDGTFHAYMRNNGLGNRVMLSRGSADANTWGKVELTNIPNPGSSVEVIALKSGRWIMICNDTTKGRHQLAIYSSFDEGKTWGQAKYLEKWPTPKEGTASYPSLLQAEDGMLHASYSYREGESAGETIKHVTVFETWLGPKP